MRSLIDEIRAIVGPAGLMTLPQEVAPYATDWRKRYRGKPAAVVKPASTAEVAEVVRACAGSRTAIVPQGGNTGLCGAATPDASGSQIVLNLSRMNRVRAIDAPVHRLGVEVVREGLGLILAPSRRDHLLPRNQITVVAGLLLKEVNPALQHFRIELLFFRDAGHSRVFLGPGAPGRNHVLLGLRGQHLCF